MSVASKQRLTSGFKCYISEGEGFSSESVAALKGKDMLVVRKSHPQQASHERFTGRHEKAAISARGQEIAKIRAGGRHYTGLLGGVGGFPEWPGFGGILGLDFFFLCRAGAGLEMAGRIVWVTGPSHCTLKGLQ